LSTYWENWADIPVTWCEPAPKSSSNVRAFEHLHDLAIQPDQRSRRPGAEVAIPVLDHEVRAAEFLRGRTLGRLFERVLRVVARARIRPDTSCEAMAVVVSKASGT
jgi:hypothetical protein